MTIEKRFWSKVKIKSATSDDCWEWQASIRKDGYGRFWKDYSTGAVKAHRVAYELGIGPIPEGQCVLHTCDNPPCCNPAHLFLGTLKDNSRDMVAKGRQARGERSSKSKLIESQVVDIRQTYPNRTQQQLADEYGITNQVVSGIINYKYWKHVIV